MIAPRGPATLRRRLGEFRHQVIDLQMVALVDSQLNLIKQRVDTLTRCRRARTGRWRCDTVLVRAGAVLLKTSTSPGESLLRV